MITAATLLLLATACGSGAPTPEAPADPVRERQPRRPDVVVFSIDTLRADHLSTWGYPRQTSPGLTSLAASSRRYSGALAVTSWTLPSLASLFTGLQPASHGLTRPEHALSTEARTLAELAQDAGYETAFFGVNPRFPDGHGLEQGFATWRVHEGMAGRQLNQELRMFLDNRETSQPLLLVVHYFEPHCRYRAPRDVAQRFVGDGLVVDPRLLSPEQYESMGDCFKLQDAQGAPALSLQTYLDAYDAEVAEVDSLVSQAWAWLAPLDPWLVVLGDHGEAFWEHGDFGHGRLLHVEQVQVPLLLRAPGTTAGSTSDAPVSTVWVGQALRAMVQGEELPEEPSEALLETSYGGRRLVALRTRERSVHVDLGRVEDAVAFELVGDPGEQEPQPAAESEVLSVMGRLANLGPAWAVVEQAELRQVEAVRALGYVE